MQYLISAPSFSTRSDGCSGIIQIWKEWSTTWLLLPSVTELFSWVVCSIIIELIFGVLLGMTNAEVLHQVEHGYRMPCPPGCPRALYEIMLECWAKDEMERPTFETLQWKLEEFFVLPASEYSESTMAVRWLRSVSSNITHSLWPPLIWNNQVCSGCNHSECSRLHSVSKSQQ